MDYENLPEVVRALLPKKEWLWLSDADKAALIENYTQPDEDYEE